MRQSGVDPYEILQVSRHAELDVIEAAYRRLARKRHPDVNGSPNALRQMQLLNWAYETLRDPIARARYDRAHPDLRVSSPGDGDWASSRTTPEHAPNGQSGVGRDRTPPQPRHDYMGNKATRPQRAPVSRRWVAILGTLLILFLALRHLSSRETPFPDPISTASMAFGDGSVMATMPIGISPEPLRSPTPLTRKVATTDVMENLGRLGFDFHPDGTRGGHPAYSADYAGTVKVLLVGEPDRLAQAQMTIWWEGVGPDTPGFPSLVRAIAPDWEHDFVSWLVEVLDGEANPATRVDNLQFEISPLSDYGEYMTGATLTVVVDD